MLSDAELARAAQSGDVTCLGVLLERHRARLYALALRMLRQPHDAQDAVHDAFLIALSRVDRLREPELVGGWLRGIVRNVCLRQLSRVRGEVLFDELPHHIEARLVEFAVEDALGQLALRDWVWAALSGLPEPLRVTAMLRHFGSYSSYEEIAVILDVLLGTVKSRLHQVKLKLADALLETAELAHDEVGGPTEHCTHAFVDGIGVFNRGTLSGAYMSVFAEDVVGSFGEWEFRGRKTFASALQQNIDDGVKVHLTSVLASDGVIVMEATFENPPEAPFHCPPAMSWVTILRDGQVRLSRIYHAPRLAEQRCAGNGIPQHP